MSRKKDPIQEPPGNTRQESVYIHEQAEAINTAAVDGRKLLLMALEEGGSDERRALASAAAGLFELIDHLAGTIRDETCTRAVEKSGPRPLEAVPAVEVPGEA